MAWCIGTDTRASRRVTLVRTARLRADDAESLRNARRRPREGRQPSPHRPPMQGDRSRRRRTSLVPARPPQPLRKTFTARAAQAPASAV